LPRYYIKLEKFPLLGNGKIDYRSLPAVEIKRDQYVPPRNKMEADLCNIWQEILKLERVGVYENFFGLGGDSILGIKVVSRIKSLGFDVQVHELFRHQTIARLGDFLIKQGGSEDKREIIKPFELILKEDREKLSADIIDAYPISALQADMLYHGDMSKKS